MVNRPSFPCGKSVSEDIDPCSYMPRVNTMLDLNMWGWNSRVFPGIDPLVVRKDDRVRIRMGKLTMTNQRGPSGILNAIGDEL